MWYLLICFVAFLLWWLIGYAIHYYRYEHGDLVDKLRAENKNLHHDLKNVEPQIDYLRRDNDLLRAEWLKVLNENKEFKDIISRLSLYARHMQQSIPHLQELEKLAKIYEGNIHERIDDVLKLQLTWVSGPSIFTDELPTTHGSYGESDLSEQESSNQLVDNGDPVQSDNADIIAAGSPVYTNTYSYRNDQRRRGGDDLSQKEESNSRDDWNNRSDALPWENIVSVWASVYSGVQESTQLQQEKQIDLPKNNADAHPSVQIHKKPHWAEIHIEKKNTYFGISWDTTDDSDNTDGENSEHTRGNHSFF